MRPRAGALALLTVALIGAPLAETAAAGGSFFNFNRDYFFPGAKVKMRNEYMSGARLRQGPYYLYLLKDVRDWDPSIEDYRRGIVLGKAQPRPRISGRVDLGHVYSVDVEFEVPELSPGRYLVSLCNLPCTYPLHNREVMATPVRVVRNAFRAELFGRVDDVMRHGGRNFYRLQRYRARGDRELKQQIIRLDRDASRQVRELEDQLAAARREVADKPGWAGMILLFGAATLLVVMMAILFVRRRGRTLPAPDPFERLLEEARSELHPRVEDSRTGDDRLRVNQ